jgi:hypothetical protein
MKELAGRCGLTVEHFELFDDYPPGTPSWRYRLFAAFRSAFGFLLPKLLAKNRMLLVLVPGSAEQPSNGDQSPAMAEASCEAVGRCAGSAREG